MDLTTLVFHEDTFFRTGDLGEISPQGYLRILGRKKDVFNTFEGTNIYPERIEIRLESMPMIKQAMLVGDGRPYITAHLTLRDDIPCEADSTDSAISERELDLYDRIAADIAVMNEDLEHIERVLAFYLYRNTFDPRTYNIVSAGKVLRNRKRFAALYATRVEHLYSRQLARGSPQLVAPGERRYPERVRPPTRH